MMKKLQWPVISSNSIKWHVTVDHVNEMFFFILYVFLDDHIYQKDCLIEQIL